jgi:hypothetical protein
VSSMTVGFSEDMALPVPGRASEPPRPPSVTKTYSHDIAQVGDWCG